MAQPSKARGGDRTDPTVVSRPRRRSHFRSGRGTPITISLAPMIDMAFLFLIFFLVTTTFERAEGILSSDLPKDRNQPAVALPVSPIVIRLSRTGPRHEDYTLQIDAFKQGFLNKQIDEVKVYLSPELKLGPIPAEKTVPLLANILAQFPALNKMEIIKNGVGVEFVKYDFDALGMSESFVYFDTVGLITKIDLLDETIEKGIRLQRALLASVKQPIPGELGEKYPFQKVEFESKGENVRKTLVI